jgi:hypothetical protein
MTAPTAGFGETRPSARRARSSAWFIQCWSSAEGVLCCACSAGDVTSTIVSIHQIQKPRGSIPSGLPYAMTLELQRKSLHPYLLPSGLYRRHRNLTGSATLNQDRSRAFTAGRELTRCVSPCPEGYSVPFQYRNLVKPRQSIAGASTRAGSMLWLWQKTFSGSYFVFNATSRS